MKTNQPKYELVKLFIGGALEGIVYTEVVGYYMEPGKVIKKPCAGGSPYKVVSCTKIN